MEIRHLNVSDDRFAISDIYEKSWKFAYRDIIPKTYLERIPKGQWVSGLDSGKVQTIVMVEDGQFIGTSSYCGSRSPEFDGFGEIVSIYLLPEFMGRGYGKKLLDAVIQELIKLGYDDIFLWVLEDNIRARKFYEKSGFLLSKYYIDDNIGGKELREIQYRYSINKTIRKLNYSDIDAVLKIWLQTNIEAHSFISESYWRNNYLTVKALLSKSEIYVYEESEIIKGFVGLNDEHIEGIFVSQQYQGKGAGKTLLDYIKTFKSTLTLSVYQKNYRALNFYKREGFKIESENMDNDTNEKEYFMIWQEDE